MAHDNPRAGRALLSILRGRYSREDLETLEQYARNEPITESTEQRAVLQFINHSMIPHQDYFEIWASKIYDLETLIGDVSEYLGKNRPEERPRLEILGEKPIALSGKRNVSVLPVAREAKTTSEVRAHVQETSRLNEAKQLAGSLVTDLYDPSKGSIKERHEAVKNRALGALTTFNAFFRNVDKALNEIDTLLVKATAERDSTEFRWERAEGISRQLKLMSLRKPGELMFERVLGDAGSAVGNSGGNPAHGIGSFIGGQLRNIFSYRRMRAEYDIQLEGLIQRNRIDPNELEARLHVLDNEVSRLTEDREFQAYIADSGLTENTRATLLLLPRIIAGENNIDAMEVRARKFGYADIDSFIEDLQLSHPTPRLAHAMESYLFGLADSNDLKVILAEANRIKEPGSRAEQLLVDYVEKVIKRHYPDQARQASTVDTLAMRNVIPTRRPFHSFGEIVKLETDGALKSLLGGTGDFSLVGSNDVHDVFAYYMSRHSDGNFFVDPHDRTKLAGKHVQTVASDEIETWRDQAIRMRSADTRIPRISSVFLEICAHEYLLSQGMNIVKNRGLGHAPQALGTLEMVNEVTRSFIGKLALYEARARVKEQASKAGVPDAKPFLGHQVEGLIARSFVDFFSELGAQHASDPAVRDRSGKVATAFTGENFSLASETYTDTIIEDARNNFDLFLRVYKKNLERYLGEATRDNKKLLLEQIDAVKDIMAHIQVTDEIVRPDSETARLEAHYRNHSLTNVGLTHSTWVDRSNAVVSGGIKTTR